MKTHIVYLIVGLLTISSLKGQVKIGNNPQNLHSASVLELESNNRVLVITRVNTAQMSAINPLRGALVYNTDEECIHYYNGVEWINICEALDNSFTVSSEAVFNTAPDARDSTVVVTQTETPDGINYNFEVNQITGDNIYNGTLFGSDLAAQSIGVRELQNGGVGLEKLEDGTLAGQLMQWNGTDWTLISEADITVTELDGIVGNEILDAADGTLVRTGSGDVLDPFVLDVSPEGIGNAELAPNAITNDKLDKTNIPLSGFGAAGADVDLGGNKLINVAEPTVGTDAATMNYVDSEIIASNQTVVSGDLGNVITIGTDNGAFYDNSTLLADIAANATNINNHTTSDEDTNNTNELQDLDLTTNILTLSNPASPGNQVNLGLYLDNTDEQDISTNGNPGNISIDNGSTINLNVDDADASDTNEINTRFEVNGLNLEIEDSNGTLQVALADINNQVIVSTDSNNSITAGTDGGAYVDTTIKPINSTNSDITVNNTHYTIILTSGGLFTPGSGVTLPTGGTLPNGKIIIIRNNSGSTVDIIGATAGSILDSTSLWVQYDGIADVWQQIN